MLHLIASSHSGGDGFEVVPIVAIVFTFLWLIVKALMAPFTSRAGKAPPPVQQSGGLTDEEHMILEKLQRTLAQMEDRVESLETILIEQRRSAKYEPKA